MNKIIFLLLTFFSISTYSYEFEVRTYSLDGKSTNVSSVGDQSDFLDYECHAIRDGSHLSLIKGKLFVDNIELDSEFNAKLEVRVSDYLFWYTWQDEFKAHLRLTDIDEKNMLKLREGFVSYIGVGNPTNCSKID
tara:strand:- start:2078 stop:2482 length:405 start_codon:yes stop_codon:yes gene_type:complete